MSVRFGPYTPPRLLVQVRSSFAPISHSSFSRSVSCSSVHRVPFLLYRRSFSKTSASRLLPPLSPHPGLASRTGLQSSVSLTSLSAGVIFAALVGFLAWQGYARDPAPPATSDSQPALLASTTDIPIVRLYPGMPAEIPPGRPGNLTSEQEAKLKELWELLHQLTNPPVRRDSTDPNGTAQSPIPNLHDAPEDSPNNAGKKKRRFGSLLGRKKDKDADSDTHSEYSVGSSSAAEDKHGQNKEYREALAKMSPAELRDALWTFSKADDPDANLCRYLRARKWNVQNALVMLISTIHWRRNVMKLDEDIMKYGEEAAIQASNGDTDAGINRTTAKDFMAQLHMGKSFLHGTDKDGRPMCFVRVRLHRGGEQTEEALERYTVWTIETARFMLRPPVDTAVIVFDMTSFTMANMDYTPVKFMIKVFEANYPESLGYVFVHKAPWIFQGVWRLIRGWLDPVVASKIHFTSDANELSQFVDMDKIPKEMGGTENWEYQYEEPVTGENEAMNDTETKEKFEKERWGIVEEYERLTDEWVRTETGSAQAEELVKKRLSVAQKLRANYWALDPYIRSRTLYDRLGLIREGGYVDMYPESRWGAGAKPAVTRTWSSHLVGGGDGTADDAASVYYDAHTDLD